MRKTIIGFAAALVATLALAACGDKKDDPPAKAEQRIEQVQPRIERTALAPAPQPVSLARIDACKDEIMAATGLTERKARRLPG